MKYFGTDDFSAIKVIVFDFDETMYYSPTVRESYVNYIKTAVMALSGCNENRAEKLMVQNGFTKENKFAPSFNSSLPNFGITRPAWDDYRRVHFFEIDYDTATIVDNEIYRKLAKKCNLYVVSNEMAENLRKKAERLGIDLAPFKKIVAPTFDGTVNISGGKVAAYSAIAEEEGLPPSQMLVVGDRMAVDVEPMLGIGGNGLFVANTDEIELFFKEHFLAD